jgi:hypothetical protein
MFLFLVFAIALVLLIGIGSLWLVLHCMQSWANFIGAGFGLFPRK